MIKPQLHDITLGQLSELSDMLGGRRRDDHPWQVGSLYLIRTLTMIDTGRLVAVTEHELVLEDAAWIADTGRFADAVAGRIPFSEVEPFPDGQVIIGRRLVVDAVQINSAPRKQV